MIADVVMGVAQTSLKHISRKQTLLINKITMHVNRLIKSINEVWGTVEYEMHGADPTNTLETPILLPPLKVELASLLFRTMHPCNLGSLGLPTY